MNTENAENEKTATENTPKKEKKVKKEEAIDLWAVCGCRACNT